MRPPDCLKLTLAESAVIAAPERYGLTLEERSVVSGLDGAEVTTTVDGVGTDIAPGEYKGAAVLAVE
jgi:hypothetical protein